MAYDLRLIHFSVFLGSFLVKHYHQLFSLANLRRKYPHLLFPRRCWLNLGGDYFGLHESSVRICLKGPYDICHSSQEGPL